MLRSGRRATKTTGPRGAAMHTTRDEREENLFEGTALAVAGVGVPPPASDVCPVRRCCGSHVERLKFRAFDGMGSPIGHRKEGSCMECLVVSYYC